MALSSIRDGGSVHNGGGGGLVLCQCGVYNGSIPSLIGDFQTLCGPACFITRAEISLRVRIIYEGSRKRTAAADADLT